MNPKLFVATKAFIIFQGKVLIVRESGSYKDSTNTGKFDIVGGRLEPGEHFKDCLLREIKEETGLEVTVGKPFFVNEWRPTKNGESWQIVGIFFECFAMTNTVTLSTDHDAYEWIDPKDYALYQVIENLHPAFKAYLEK